MNKYNIVLLPALILFLIIGCAKDEPQAVSDAQLIQEIIDYNNKVEVSMEDLPSNAISLMENEYLVEYLHLYSLKASSLGYEVSLAGRAGAMGDRGEIYFDINGRKLDPNNTHDYERDWYDGSDGFEGARERDNWKCFQIEFPYTIQMPNGVTYTIDSDDDLDFEEIKNYYEQNSGMDDRPSIVFPINITTNDGESVTINNEDDMKDAYRDCSRRDRDWGEDKECFALVYPVTYIAPDGSTFEISSEEDEAGWEALKAWYETNPDSEAMPALSYPVSITYRSEEGEDIVIINNEEEMYAAKEECREMWDEGDEEWDEGDEEWDEECYSFVYPLTFIVSDGSSFVINSEEDESGWYAIGRWYEENPNTEEEPSLSYPVDVITWDNEDSTTTTITTSEELESFEQNNCG